MEWSKVKTLRLVELLQVNSVLWNPSVCESRRAKQKRKEELRSISKLLDLTVADVTKKIQHLRTQYNREAAREARVKTDDPANRYISNWYAFEYLHFLKDLTKPFRLLNSEEFTENTNASLHSDLLADGKLAPRSPPRKMSRADSMTPLSVVKNEMSFSTSPKPLRDEFSVFGEYVANELRSLQGEKNLLVAKKKIQDAIFEVKIGSIHEPQALQPAPVVEPHHGHQHHSQGMHNGKLFSPPSMSAGGQTESLPHQGPPAPNISEIMITNCHYNNFKVDQQ